jgi:hypothetical protein
MAGRRGTKRWSRAVTEHSNALDLETGVFRGTPTQIARSLKRSADRSTRRKATPFRSAMSMLVFYENRAGANLSPARKRALERAKDELRRLYGRDRGHGSSPASGSPGASVSRRSHSAVRKPARAAGGARSSR